MAIKNTAQKWFTAVKESYYRRVFETDRKPVDVDNSCDRGRALLSTPATRSTKSRLVSYQSHEENAPLVSTTAIRPTKRRLSSPAASENCSPLVSTPVARLPRSTRLSSQSHHESPPQLSTPAAIRSGSRPALVSTGG